MNNNDPISILGIHPSGAIPNTPDSRDYPAVSPEIGMAPVPFDWNVGYEVEKDTGIRVTRKDQAQSGSCGGQSISEAAQSLSVKFLGENSEKSAKAYYSQVYIPGGGSSSRALAEILIKQGFFKEELVRSYPQDGSGTTEAFMERPQDITQGARSDAAPSAGLFAYVYPQVTIDAIGQAVRDHQGVFIGIHGYNNGTWLSSNPSTKEVGSPWAHFMVVIGAKLINGKKNLICLQSWGPDAPDATQIQYISEDHFTAGHIWDAIAFVYAPMPPHPKHVFNVTMVYGQTSDEVRAMQALFANDGVFNLNPTGFYGPATALAVLKFRTKHGIDSSTDKYGHSVGPSTRKVMNTL
jgi:hypothetical protein